MGLRITPLGITKTPCALKIPPGILPNPFVRKATERGDPPPEVVPPGPDNPLVQHAILFGYSRLFNPRHYMNQDGIGIARQSRLYPHLHPDDIKSRIRADTHTVPQVNIIDEPIKPWFGDRQSNCRTCQAFTSLMNKNEQ